MSERGNEAAAERLDARVHRCGGCGTWCYGSRPCTTCAIAKVHEGTTEEAS